jgi:hypothetical protein
MFFCFVGLGLFFRSHGGYRHVELLDCRAADVREDRRVAAGASSMAE